MKKQSERVYQLKISLNGIRPPVWRRLLVPAGTDLANLHTMIQIAMGWTDSHLHQFIVGRKAYREPDPDFEDDSAPEAGVPIGSLLRKEKQWLTYEYDFGDDWIHRVTLEKTFPTDAGETLPKCTGGKRSSPPEDVGGVYGYAEFLRAYEDETHPEHDEYIEWAGDYFHPDRCDIDEINEILSQAFGRA